MLYLSECLGIPHRQNIGLSYFYHFSLDSSVLCIKILQPGEIFTLVYYRSIKVHKYHKFSRMKADQQTIFTFFILHVAYVLSLVNHHILPRSTQWTESMLRVHSFSRFTGYLLYYTLCSKYLTTGNKQFPFVMQHGFWWEKKQKKTISNWYLACQIKVTEKNK